MKTLLDRVILLKSECERDLERMKQMHKETQNNIKTLQNTKKQIEEIYKEIKRRSEGN